MRIAPLLALFALFALTLALVGAASAHPAAAPGPATALPGPGSSEQAVAVAYLDPDIVLSLDVVTGRLELSSDTVGFAPGGPPWAKQRPVHPYDTGVAAIYDPLDRRLYRYTGGIPGYAAAPAERAAVITAGATAPVWAGRRCSRTACG